MKRKNILALLAVSIFLCSCSEKGCQKNRRNRITSKRDYSIVLYSGGDTVFYEKFHGIVTEEEGSGAYYFKGDTLVEINGDYVIKSVK